MNANLKAFADATNNELIDPDWNGGEWMVEAVETHETLEQFIDSSQNWSERSAMVQGEIGGMPFIVWRNVQVAKGQPRRQMSVVDLGDVRYAIDCDLTDYA